jgi:hypothetical protein
MLYTTHSIAAFLDSLENIFEEGCAFWRRRNCPTSQIHRELTQPKWLSPFPLSSLYSLHVIGTVKALPIVDSLSQLVRRGCLFFLSITCVPPRTALICLYHEVRIYEYKEYLPCTFCTVYVPSSELGLSQLFSRQRVCTSPQNRGGGGAHTRLRVRGWGVPIPTIGEKLSTLPTLWAVPICCPICVFFKESLEPCGSLKYLKINAAN